MSKKKNEEEISIPELIVRFQKYLKFLRKKQLAIWIWVVIMFVFGVINVVTSEDEYEAVNVVLTYSASGTNASAQAASRLAGLAGIQLPTGQVGETRVVSEMMIPTILNTYPVAYKLGTQELRFYNEGVTLTGLEYFSRPPQKTILDHLKSWTIEAPIRFLQWIMTKIVGEPERVRPPDTTQQSSSSEPQVDTPQTDSISQTRTRTERSRPEHIFVDNRTNFALSQLTSRITVNVEGNVITVTANMPDPYAAADLAQIATDILMQELVNFEIRKTEEDLEFLMELYHESEEKYYRTLRNLTDLQDRLRNVTTSSANIEQIKATGENEIARKQFGQITMRVEQARIKLKEDTPSFAVLNPVQIPQRPSNANPVGVMIIFIFLGGFLGIGWVTVRGVYQAMKAEAEAESKSES